MSSILYFATGNAGKLRDFAVAADSFAAAGGGPFTLLPLPGLDAIPPPIEDAETFEGNARLKALAYSRHAPDCIVLADDSGIEVDALHGEPGVYSARYAERAGVLEVSSDGANASIDEANNQHLLAELAHALAPSGLAASLEHRGGRYRCVLAAARDGLCLCTAEGSVEGRIQREPRGEGGFGYDPLFFLPALGQTMAQLDPATRLSLSHRGAALRALLPRLAEFMNLR